MTELTGWTVYDHPNDHPDCFIARKWIASAGKIEATTDIICAGDLATLRAAMVQRGLIVLNRDPKDDPTILEIWL